MCKTRLCQFEEVFLQEHFSILQLGSRTAHGLRQELHSVPDGRFLLIGAGLEGTHSLNRRTQNVRISLCRCQSEEVFLQEHCGKHAYRVVIRLYGCLGLLFELPTFFLYYQNYIDLPTTHQRFLQCSPIICYSYPLYASTSVSRF